MLGKALSATELLPGDGRLPDSFRANGWGGLLADMAFNLGTQAGRDALSNIKFGALDEWSFMFIPDVVREIRNDRDRAAPNHIADIESITQIVEFSPVVVGANPATVTIGAKDTHRVRRMPTAFDLAIAQMVVDAGRRAGAKAVYGSWWRVHQ